jgi:hypothetical protein
MSTAKAECWALAAGVKKALWPKKRFILFGWQGSAPVLLDNRADVKIASDPSFDQRAEHIDIHFHFFRESAMGDVSVEHV